METDPLDARYPFGRYLVWNRRADIRRAIPEPRLARLVDTPFFSAPMGAMKKFVPALIIFFVIVAGFQALRTEAPVDYFLRYQTMIAEGRTFEDDAQFYALSRRAEIQAQLDAQADGAEGLKAAYLEMTTRQAKCSKLVLVEETKTETTARLVFDVTDTCGAYDADAKVQEIIELIEEDGSWKILSNVTSVR